jgi:ribosomal protein S12 methylthiotransferase accessory factor
VTALRLRPVRRSSPGETLRKGRRLVDPDCGIIRALYESPVEPDAPQIFGFGSILADTASYGVEDFGLVNGSTSISRAQAAAGAVGEAVERYASRFVPFADLVRDCYTALGSQALDPRLLPLYDDEQYDRPGFPYRRFDEAAPLPWVAAHSITRDRQVLVPAVAVFMAPVDPPGIAPLVQQTTNGLACGNTLEEAILSGLCEVVERDASMLTWLRRTSGPHLDCSSVEDPRLARCLQLFEQARVGVDLIDITTDLDIPCVLAATRLGSRHAHAPVFASAANLSSAVAASRALEELAQCIPWVKALIDRGRARPPIPVDRVSTTEDHVVWAAAPERQQLVRFLTAGAGRSSRDDDRNESRGDVLDDLFTCLRRLAERGLEVLVTDLTPPDIADIGLHVVRVLVPGALPLSFGSGLQRVDERAVSRTGGPTQLNLLPHPYP